MTSRGGGRGRAAPGNHVHPDGASRPTRGLGRFRVPLPQRLMSSFRASTSGSSPIARHAPSRRSNERPGVDRRRSGVPGNRTGRRLWLPPHGRRPEGPAEGRQADLLPFTGSSISRRAFEAAVRLATAENEKIVPAFLARVPRYLPIESAVPAQCSDGMLLLEAIEQKAAAQGLTVDARVRRGRSYRDALRRLLAEEHFDRVIVGDRQPADRAERRGPGVAARAGAGRGLNLRPAPDDKREISVAAGVNGHF